MMIVDTVARPHTAHRDESREMRECTEIAALACSPTAAIQSSVLSHKAHAAWLRNSPACGKGSGNSGEMDETREEVEETSAWQCSGEDSSKSTVDWKQARRGEAAAKTR